MTTRIPFIGGAYRGRTPNVDIQQCINWYQEGDVKDDRSPKQAIPTPGISSFYQIAASTTVVQGLHYYNDLLLVVCNATLYSLTLGASPSLTTIGALTGLSTSTYVQMFDNGPANGQQVWIGDGASAWVYDSSVPSITKMSATQGYPSGGVGCMTMQDTYGIFTVPNSNVFWLTDALNFANVTSTNFATPESILDQITAIISDGARLYIFGLRDMEIWYNSGDADFTFTKITGCTYPVGCIAAKSAVKIDNSIVFLGSNEWGQPSIFQVRGTDPPRRISTPQIDWILSNGSSPQTGTSINAFAFAYKDQGHEFYVLQLNTGGITFVWDATTNEWHQRASATALVASGAWAAACHEFIPQTSTNQGGNHFVGVTGSNGTIGKLDYTSITDLGNAITRTLVTPHLNSLDDRIFINILQVIGNFSTANTGQSGGTLTLTYSKDNGNTFPSTQTYTITADYVQRMIFRRLGLSRDWVFKLVTTAAPIIMDCFINERSHLANRETADSNV